ADRPAHPLLGLRRHRAPGPAARYGAGGRPGRRGAHRPRHHRRLVRRRGRTPGRADGDPRHGVVLPLARRRPAADQRPPAGLPLRPGAPGIRRRAGAAAHRAAGTGRADRRGAGRRRLPGALGRDRGALRRWCRRAAAHRPGPRGGRRRRHGGPRLRHPAAPRQPVLRRQDRHRRPRGDRPGACGRWGAGVRPRAGDQAGPRGGRRRDRRHDRGGAARPGDRPPRPLRRRARPSAGRSGRPGPAHHRVQRLPRHQQDDAHRRLHHRPAAVRGAGGRRHRQRAVHRL
ncbi:MAG: FIG00031715: Predicted metal-dependent phosphoesterases (PHP family), partial [uncultured Blastococcus sp.]